MVGMELDLPPDRDSLLSPRDHIVRRLAMRGIPQLHLQHFQLGLVAFVRDNKCMISEIVSSILPTILDLIEAQMLPSRELAGVSGKFSIKELFEESILWLQWLMFEGDPQESMNSLAQSCDGQHAVCGAVWGHNDLAYRCRTCEQDPTCAICVPCFQRGNHKDHDYNIIYTGGGCCDCGDETAWKKEGFCSEHKGTEQIRPLPQELAISIGPVLDSLLLYWKDMIMSVEHKHGEDADHGDAYKKTADGLSSAIIQMLINFCNCSESLLSFISSRLMSCSGLPHVLLKAEKLLDTVVVKMLHELLLKLLGDPLFKYNFAKIFIQYYPTIVKQIIKDSSSDSYTERDPMLTTFSVQIYTVPTLTMRLVTEVDLLSVLLGCLKDLFLSCFDAGHLQASKWANIYNTTVRLIEDFRYVMSHQEVPAYVVCERPDISKSWIFLLRLVQGMDAQKRVTGLHTEEENENLIIPFVLGQYLGNVNALFVGGAFYDVKNGCLDKQGPVDIDQQRHAKVGRVSQESSASRTGALEALQFNETHIVGENGKCLPSSVVWLISECLKAIECWLRPEIESSCGIATTNASDLLALKKKSSRGRKGPNIVNRTSMTRMDVDGVEIPFTGDSNWSFGRGSVPEDERVGASRSNDSLHIGETNEFFLDPSYSSRVSDDTLMEVEYCRESTAFSILSMTDWPAINCDVSSQAISFHIPLHRLLSLLLRKALEGCCNVIELPHKANGPTAAIPIHNQDFFRKALSGLHPCGFSAFIMEHPLQLRVFCAQVRAGMWRKNSDAPILSSDWYRSVQRLEQGLESDLFLLQCCAALAPPDSFVQRVLERYGLLNYMSLNLADYNEFEPVLVQEMLTLLIQIVKERRFCGLSMTQNLQRELVYRLAIGDSTHSQLVKSLPRDLSKSDRLQNIVEMLALYRNPSGMKQGKYSLQKAYWKELDLYHPRWSSRELQVAEERFFRFCKVSALNTQLPRWTPIFEPLASVCRIATSKMVLQIVRVVFFYANFSERSSVSRAPDAVLITALHLVSLALDICETYQFSQTDDPLPILASASEEFDVGSSSASVVWKNQSMLSLLVSLMGKHKKQNDDVYSQTSQCSISSLIEALLKKFAQLNSNCMSELKRLAPGVVCNVPQVNSSAQSLTYTSDIDERKLKARQRQAAILEKMKAEQSKFIESLSSNNTEQESYKQKESLPKVDARDESVPVCSLCHDPDSGSRLCLLILLQKSRLASFVDRGPPHWENTGLSHNSHKEVNLSGKLKLIDSSGPHTSSPLQFVEIAGPEDDHDVEPVEVDTFLDFIRDRIPDIGNFQLPKVSHDPAKDSFSFLELMEIYLFDSIMEDMHETQSYSHSGSGESNCSTSAVDSNISQDLGSVLREYVACLSRISSKKQNSSLYDILHLGNLSSKPKGTITSVTRFGPKDCDGIYISSCGHAVHQDCHERYLTSLKQRNIRRLGFEGGHIIDPDLGELLCPVCRRFANSVLPVLPSPADKYGKHVKVSSKIAEVDNISQLPLALSLLQSAEKKVGGGRFLKTCFGKLRETTEPALEPTLRKLYMLYYPHNYNDLSESGRLSQSLVLWDNLRYSLVSTEIAARGRVRASHANSPLKALYGELNSSSGFILPLLLNVAKTTCSSSSIEVLLRFRGIQLFARSICFGISEDCNFTNSDKRRGSLKLEHAESGESFPDIQFWKRAADPIVAHDPFSSLMWVLFCLPSFMLSSEFFIPLVHLFYTVSVIQSLITCFSKGFFDASHFTESPLCDLCQVMGKSLPVKKYFVSNCIDLLCPPKDMIRRLTFPYLRRCALLWKLLQSSTTALFDTSNVSEGLNPHSKTDTLEFDNANYLKMELDGIRELEDLFHVSSFEVILKDEVVHSLALKWCKHFSEELKANRFEGVLYYTPAVPFKLMQLPRVYQDLLLRYVKVECSECNSVPEEPALCLLCGKLCSPSWKSCCRASRCLNHAISCGAGLGVFLLVRKTTILLQRSSRQAFWPSPYLDAFGEEDIDVLRGKPLFLNAERYAALTYLVASHGLDRTSEVLRQTTISVFGSD